MSPLLTAHGECRVYTNGQNRRGVRIGDPLAAILDDEEHSLDEPREIVIGHSTRPRRLVVSFAQRGADLVRIISARNATKSESTDDEEGTGL